MTSPAVQLDQLDSVPLAVIRRQASASEFSRVVPECCGLVWNAVRAQQARAGRHVAIYWDGGIRLEVGVELYGPFAEEGESWTNGRRSRRPRSASRRHLRFGPLRRAGSDPERGRDLGDAGSAPGRPCFMKCPVSGGSGFIFQRLA